MSAQEFKPGDRVRVVFESGWESNGVVADAPSRADIEQDWLVVGTVAVVPSKEAVSLVSRPVYPEPGQVVVALDTECLSLFDDGKWLDMVGRISDAIDRAREAVKP